MCNFTLAILLLWHSLVKKISFVITLPNVSFGNASKDLVSCCVTSLLIVVFSCIKKKFSITVPFLKISKVVQLGGLSCAHPYTSKNCSNGYHVIYFREFFKKIFYD